MRRDPYQTVEDGYWILTIANIFRKDRDARTNRSFAPELTSAEDAERELADRNPKYGGWFKVERIPITADPHCPTQTASA